MFTALSIHHRFEKAQFNQGSDRHRFKMEQDTRALVIEAGGQTMKIQKSYGIIVVHKIGLICYREVIN